MKQILNRKNFLKATFAVSSFILVGCASQTADTSSDYDYYNEDLTVINEEQPVMVEENSAVAPQIDETEPCIIVKSEEEALAYTRKKRTSVSASSPAEPRIVPVKPAKTAQVTTKKTVSKKKTTEVSKKTTTQEAVVKQKPESAPTPIEVAQKPDVVSVEEVSVTETTTPVPEKKPDFPVVDTVVEQEVIVEETSADSEQQAREEAERLAKEQAERDRLQKEMERLRAEKEALEQEKVRITQIQTTKVESCKDVKDWVAAEGTTLRSLLMDWGDRVGWRVVWNMDRDYTLEAGAVFRGRFVDVAAALLRSFARATPAPKGIFYKGNKVLVISTREDENAD